MKARILALAEALDVSVATSVRRDECNDWRIVGRNGHIYADGDRFLIVCHPGRNTAHRWMNLKRNLSFCRVTQDGDDEGCLQLDRLPDEREAEEIRDAIHVRRRVQASPGQLAALERARASARAATIAPSVRYSATAAPEEGCEAANEKNELSGPAGRGPAE
jgi:hypothetical protein